MVNIVCHIVGMNNKLKEYFIKFINDNYSDVVIKDLDEITNSIRNNDDMIKLNNKIKDHSNNKQIIAKINSLWKSTLETKLDNLYKHYANTNLIILGLSTFHRNHKIKVNITTPNKFFVKIDPTKNAKDVIEHNLIKYKDNIVNGTFPLRHLDYDFLINQRERLIEIYSKMNYMQKSFDQIMKFVETSLDETKKEFTNIYVGSGLKEIKLNDKVYGYRYKWLAALASINDINNHIKKGFIEDSGTSTPFIEEKYKNAFNVLDGGCYLYEVNKQPFTKYNWYKFISTQTTNSVPFTIAIQNTEKIDNIKQFLNKNEVKMIKYK